MKLLKLLRFFVVFILILFGIPCVLFTVSRNRSLPQKKIESVIPSPVNPYKKLALPKQSDKYQYRVLEKQLVELVNSHDPRVALNYLAEVIKTNDHILNNCHAIAHAVGNAAYKKYQDVDTALQYSDEVCGSGYIHGVIEERILLSKDVYTELKTMCKPDSGNCFHGIGHGLMYYTSNDLPEALKLCDTLFNNKAKEFCGEGVFMENFNTEEDIHPNKYLDKNNPLYPCPDQTNFYKGACYFYQPDYYLRLHENDFVGALQQCNSVEKDFRVTCINGVGSRTMKRNINNPQFTESICMTLSEVDRKYCIDGMVSYYIVHNYSLAKGRELCTLLEEKNRAQCVSSVNARTSMFPE